MSQTGSSGAVASPAGGTARGTRPSCSGATDRSSKRDAGCRRLRSLLISAKNSTQSGLIGLGHSHFTGCALAVALLEVQTARSPCSPPGATTVASPSRFRALNRRSRRFQKPIVIPCTTSPSCYSSGIRLRCIAARLGLPHANRAGVPARWCSSRALLGSEGVEAAASFIPGERLRIGPHATNVNLARPSVSLATGIADGFSSSRSHELGTGG